MIRLELVNKDNFDQVLDLEVAPKDQRRVASVEYSLAQAWLYREEGHLLPYAVKSGQRIVGFVLLSIQEDKSYYVWRLLIDRHYQNRGYGKEVIRQVIGLAKEDPSCHTITMNYVIGNHKMRYILEKLGFQSVGLEGQEMKMEISIK
ncbi:GNAT family N-acetyltransferase [Streptococcus suis]|uniref:Histone acetyltransferase HPA2-like acetyltransferase n=1 Tax=Streptococcus suis TaxID=1307 RepID=A0A116NAP3_STRSU|nr:GNAT family N-acetyltransferase [Streptococcus suis]NQF81956.1 GNAT family N-acetyltransferase [Streptococcus suis]NQO83578.1 GNAT family N-acetyltransferase [Streptococcus suis]NQP53541.1 GNAT family N-acetyltransferase [Streptococcus suis]CYV92239.1 histone acetyltransferase HPA2-like acetyltransferase [Streptococcus suis]HEM5504503.1 GNAT family N-acetyltransferase [Streptococcus suis]